MFSKWQQQLDALLQSKLRSGPSTSDLQITLETGVEGSKLHSKRVFKVKLYFPLRMTSTDNVRVSGNSIFSTRFEWMLTFAPLSASVVCNPTYAIRAPRAKYNIPSSQPIQECSSTDTEEYENSLKSLVRHYSSTPDIRM